MLQLSDLSFAEKQIKVRKEVAKNGQERLVPISDEILESLLDLGINQVPNHFYIFGRNYKPGEQNIYTNHVDPNLRDIILSKAPKFSKGKEERNEHAQP